MEMQTSLFAELLTATQLLTDGQDLQLYRAFIYYFFYTTISFSTTFFCGFSYILYLMNTKITDESTHTYTTEQLTGLQTSNISMHTQNEHFGCQFSEM